MNSINGARPQRLTEQAPEAQQPAQGDAANDPWKTPAPLPQRAAYLTRSQGPNLDTAAFEAAHRESALRLDERIPEPTIEEPAAGAEVVSDTTEEGEFDVQQFARKARRGRIFQALEAQTRRERSRARREAVIIATFMFLVVAATLPGAALAPMAAAVGLGAAVGFVAHRFGDGGTSWFVATTLGIGALAPLASGTTYYLFGAVVCCSGWLIGRLRQME